MTQAVPEQRFFMLAVYLHHLGALKSPPAQPLCRFFQSYWGGARASGAGRLVSPR